MLAAAVAAAIAVYAAVGFWLVPRILRGQVQLYGPDRTPACRLAPTRYDKMIEALGGHGEWVEKPADLRPALERALGAGKPAVVNVRIGASDFRKDAISV